MRVDIATLTLIAADIRALCGDDEQTFLDTMEGETDAMEVIDALLVERAEALAMSKAIKAQADEWRDRAARLEGRAKARQEALRKVLIAIGAAKVERPAGTVYTIKGRAKAVPIRPDDTPSQLCRIKSEPDRSAILAAMKAGEDVPGWALGTSDDAVGVRS